jgi:hypothetical protein
VSLFVARRSVRLSRSVVILGVPDRSLNLKLSELQSFALSIMLHIVLRDRLSSRIIAGTLYLSRWRVQTARLLPGEVSFRLVSSLYPMIIRDVKTKSGNGIHFLWVNVGYIQHPA